MQNQATTSAGDGPAAPAAVGRAQWRAHGRALALKNALHKRAAGVPTYSVPEAAALLSISQEHLYRLIHADAFPAVRMCLGGEQGRYVVPAQAVERLLEVAAEAGGCVDVREWTRTWQPAEPAAPALGESRLAGPSAAPSARTGRGGGR